MTKNLGPNDRYRVLAGEDPELSLARWEEMEHVEKRDWAQAMLDFMPTFPGPTMMNFIYGPVRAGDTSNLGAAWEHNAGAFSLLGFTAADFYVLDLCIGRRLDDVLAWAGEKFCIRSFDPKIALGLIPGDWSEWLGFVRDGVTPMRALDLVLDGDKRSWPSSIIRWDDGSVEVSI